MADITITPAGLPFGGTDTVTSTRLNEARNPTAALVAASIGTADIADDAITTALIDNSSVTKAKIENISAPLKVLGRTTAGAGVAEEVTINDDDDLSTASAITLATDESIKAYVDTTTAFTPSTYAGEESVTLPNGLIMKMGYSVGSTGTVTFSTAFTTSLLSVCITIKDTAAQSTNATVTADSSTAFTYASAGGTTGVFWQAIGY